MVRLFLRIWERFFGEGLRKVEAESLAYRTAHAGGGVDWKVPVVILTATGCLTIQNYAGHPDRLVWPVGIVANLVGGPDARAEATATLHAWTRSQNSRLTWAGLCMTLSYTVLPVLVIKLGFREKLTDYGIGVRGVGADWPIYLLFALVMLPLVWLVSAEDRFQETYPFYRAETSDQLGAAFVRWELIYALQFVGLEFFFRGFMVHGTKHRFGAYAVFVMVVPYCMIHFQKPLPEACGSIIAGVALGLLSLVTRSVWPGAALHIMVAWTMDFSALVRQGVIG